MRNKHKHKTNQFIKTAFLLSILFLLLSCGNKTKHDTGDIEESVVYVCASNSARRYHVDPECKGLSRCSHTFITTTVEDARVKGRTPCRICAYWNLPSKRKTNTKENTSSLERCLSSLMSSNSRQHRTDCAWSLVSLLPWGEEVIAFRQELNHIRAATMPTLANRLDWFGEKISLTEVIQFFHTAKKTDFYE